MKEMKIKVCVSGRGGGRFEPLGVASVVTSQQV